MLKEKEIREIKLELINSKKPLFFFHDDPDGLCSFLLFYRFLREGNGIVVKARPKLDKTYIKKVKEFLPDKIFILDLALVDEEFINKANTSIIWIDHHNPQKTKVKYFNPRIENIKDNIPVTYTCYQVVRQDLWLAMCGCIGDWYFPDFADEFKELYPDLLLNAHTPEEALFETPLGELIRILSLILKGSTREVKKCIKILTRINDPYELLNTSTPRARYIHKRYSKIFNKYKELLDKAIKQVKDKVVVFTYPDEKISFTGDLANELLYKFPDKLIVVGRIKNEDVRASIRAKDTILPPIIEKALNGLEGYGGGHEHACGVSVKVNDFKIFVKRLTELFSSKLSF